MHTFTHIVFGNEAIIPIVRLSVRPSVRPPFHPSLHLKRLGGNVISSAPTL